ncbi:hypothetical protein TNCV_4005751 [Trichonephila clavipes]|nr:hypothetical protein TNCV_4005751 [Trichonephila clavipes]
MNPKYDGKVLAVCEATTQLLAVGIAPAKVVFFINSQASIIALSSNTPTDYLNTTQYRTKLTELNTYGWTVAPQWVPRHVGITSMLEPTKKSNRELGRIDRKYS